MDLKQELLEVLDNPATVWDAVVANFSSHTRINLLVLATCKTPIDIIDWQAATARVSLEAAAAFESSLRALDDSFVRASRRGGSTHFVEWRNPSMDDYCAAHLDRNAGFATKIATHQPTRDQVERLIELGLARDPQDWPRPMHANLQAALITDSTLLLDRLLELLPDPPEPTAEFMDIAKLILALVGTFGAKEPVRMEEVRARLIPVLLKLSFTNDQRALYPLLDTRSFAIALARLLGDRLEVFYEGLAATAVSLDHFDSLVNFDTAIDRTADQASWAERFESLNDEWLEESLDAESARSKREYYTKVAEYLDLSDLSGVAAWDDYVAVAEAQEGSGADSDDDRWRDSPDDDESDNDTSTGAFSSAFTAQARETAAINAMFDSLRSSAD